MEVSSQVNYIHKHFIIPLMIHFEDNVHASSNSVANRLARFARCNKLDFFSFDETPAIIQDVFYEDLCFKKKCTCFIS